MSEEGKKKIGDSCRGEKNYGAKLANEQVYQIKEMFRDGLSNKEIANKFNVKPAYINKTKTGETWKHIKVEGFTESKNKLSVEQVIEIKIMLKQGIKIKDIAKLTGINRRRMYGIRDGLTWSHIDISNLPISQADFIYLDKNNIKEIID